MWPKQDDVDVKGYDTAKKPGKLSTDWQWGDPIDIEGKNFDNLALNCSTLKQVSGTLDSVLIRIETKGLNDSGFSINQTTSGSISGSYAEEIVLRDEIFRKDIDYGSEISEVSFKLPIDLKNTKQIRIAVKQKVGQGDDKNKLFLAIGRFVKSQNTTNET